MDSWRIEIPLAPIGKGRPRMSRGGHVYTPGSTGRWEADVALMAAAQLPKAPFDGPVRVDVLAVLPRPKYMRRKKDPTGLIWAPVRPDKDNVEKAVLDALKRHWGDDAQVCAGETLKAYAELDGLPRTVIRISTLCEGGNGPLATAQALGLMDAPQDETFDAGGAL